MEPQPQDQAGIQEPVSTILRFCRRHRIPLDHDQRSRLGVELSRVCRERGITLRRVREKLEDGVWSKSRLYPVSLLHEWLDRFRQGRPEPTPAASPPANE
jgi:hypothetical protein